MKVEEVLLHKDGRNLPQPHAAVAVVHSCSSWDEVRCFWLLHFGANTVPLRSGVVEWSSKERKNGHVKSLFLALERNEILLFSLLHTHKNTYHVFLPAAIDFWAPSPVSTHNIFHVFKWRICGKCMHWHLRQTSDFT